MIQIINVSKMYRIGKKNIHAVKEVSLSIEKGEILALIGASGCGKSTLGKMLLGLIKPTSGEIFFEGKKVTKNMPTRMQMIFQDPLSSLNPRMTVGDIVKEPLIIHRRHFPKVDELLELVGLNPSLKNRFPHEFSGGQRQRIGIARALALHPDFLVCDEPISALDVSIQAQIINLLLRLQSELKLTCLFIAHNLVLAQYISNRVAVMYQGKIVECGLAQELHIKQSHHHTKELLDSSLKIPKQIHHS